MSKLIIAYSCNDRLLLDLDHTTKTKVHKLAELIQKNYTDLGGYLILETTPPESDTPTVVHPAHSHPILSQELGGYHLVYCHQIKWKRIMHILRTLTGLGVYTTRHLRIRRFRKDLTLRISEKPTQVAHKPAPQWIILKPCCNKCFEFIKYYLSLVEAVKN